MEFWIVFYFFLHCMVVVVVSILFLFLTREKKYINLTSKYDLIIIINSVVGWSSCSHTLIIRSTFWIFFFFMANICHHRWWWLFCCDFFVKNFFFAIKNSSKMSSSPFTFDRKFFYDFFFKFLILKIQFFQLFSFIL